MTKGQREDWRIAVHTIESRFGYSRAKARRLVNYLLRKHGVMPRWINRLGTRMQHPPLSTIVD